MTPEQRSRAMAAVKLKNGPLERQIQNQLKSLGLRFRCNVKTLPGSPDIVFRKQKILVFIDGDFWHGYKLSAWEHKLSPFWKEKLHKNRSRDQKNFQKLRYRGWKVIRIWEHQIKKDLSACTHRILQALENSKIASRSL
ncbi:MAG: Vsr domain protein mismatch repair endonuclease [Pedosphaera sp.]|nr:Vsr domain protein mismatch repair endonuclease [Pedosphaera sp.]